MLNFQNTASLTYFINGCGNHSNYDVQLLLMTKEVINGHIKF